jgi:SAM-dependent methyltransferase
VIGVSRSDTTAPLRVHPSNAAALAAWDGADGDYWVANETTFDASLARYRQPFLEATGIAATDIVLDIGCGNGQSTRDAARLAPSGSALGIDLSTRMLAQARRRAREEGLTNVDFVRGDAQIHPFDRASFDAAISHTGAMFFGDPVAAFRNIAGALRPRRRLTLLVWQRPSDNEWIRDLTDTLAAGRRLPPPAPGQAGPFSLADPDRTRGLLTSAGFGAVTIDGVEQPMWFGATADDAYEFVSGLGITRALLEDLDPAARGRALDTLRAGIDAHRSAEGVLYPSAMWLVSARGR